MCTSKSCLCYECQEDYDPRNVVLENLQESMDEIIKQRESYED